MVNCFAYGCSHRTVRHKCSFFRFPKDKKIRALWTDRSRRLDREPDDNSRLCSCHFKDGNKKNPTEFSYRQEKAFNFTSPEKPHKRRRPAKLSDVQHPDRVPHVLMGYKNKLDAIITINRYHQAKFRSGASNVQAGSTSEDIEPDGSLEVEDNANEADISTSIEVPSSSQSRQRNSFGVPTDYIELGSVLESIPLPSNQMGLDIEPDGSFIKVEGNANEANISTSIEVPSSSQSRQRNSFRVPTDYMELASVLESIPLPSGWCKISKPDDKLYLFTSYGCLNFSEEEDIKDLLHALSTPAKMVVVDIKRLSFSCHVYVNTRFLKSVETYLGSEVADLLVSTDNILPCTGVGTLKEFNFEYSDKNLDDSNRILYSNNCQGSVWSSSGIQSCVNCKSAREGLLKTIEPR